MSAEGYEGLADGDAHGFTIRGLNVEDGDVLDSVRITVRDAQGGLVATISKELFHWTDTYVLDVQDPSNALYVLMIALAIDAAQCSDS